MKKPSNQENLETKDKEEQAVVEEKKVDLPKPTRKLWVEILLSALIIVLFSLIVTLVVHFLPIEKGDTSHLVSFTYSADKEITFDSRFGYISLINGLLVSVAYFLSFFFVRPSGIKPTLGEKHRYLIAWIILGVFGYLAYLVIAIFLSGFISFALSSLIASLLVGLYDYLIYKLYMESRTLSNALFWEIFRFAIVGLVASVFDLATCSLVQFGAFRGNTDWYVTIIATACGFLVGVVINYLMSTYMVYKNTHSSFSKTAGGMVTFFILSAIGLFIGIGLQYLLYDFLCLKQGVTFLSYPVDFVIRTLIVMVYNYVTRKVFIYR